MAKPRPLPDAAAEAPLPPEKPHYLGHRERLLAAGAEALRDYELLELLLYPAWPPAT